VSRLICLRPALQCWIVHIIIRELIVEGTLEGLAAARARGQRLGRPPAMTPEQIRHARALLTQPDATIASIARLIGVSRSTSPSSRLTATSGP
jgi:DNA invertase Pin-like site-specific DNA recombinase